MLLSVGVGEGNDRKEWFYSIDHCLLWKQTATKHSRLFFFIYLKCPLRINLGPDVAIDSSQTHPRKPAGGLRAVS